MKKILVTNLMMLADEARFTSLLENYSFEVIVKRPKQFFDEKACLSLVGEIDGWLAGDDIISAKVIEKALPRLKVISKWGTGLDSIDLKAAAQLGVPVHNTPAAFQDAVAEVALSYMLELARSVIRTDRLIREGEWPKSPSSGLMKKTVGIIGFGAIGQGIAKRASAFDMNVCFYDPYATNKSNSPHTKSDSVKELLEQSDYVCLACNLSKENIHIMNAQTLSFMKKGAFIINVARGPLIKEDDLIDALTKGHIGGAGLDVFENEPLSLTSPLRDLNNVILGSHNANNVSSVVEDVHENTIANLVKYF